MKKPSPYGHGWGWQLEEGQLCNWAEPSREQLVAKGSPGCCKPVAVRIVLEKDFRKLLKRLEQLSKPYVKNRIAKPRRAARASPELTKALNCLLKHPKERASR